ncbi:MAG: UDP-3-O-(3-hydroxymyristoyl)glucosamine N-acyltransferase [Pseudomonadota bacterium]
MTEPQFYSRPKGMTVAEIAALTGAEALAGVDLTRTITNVAPIDLAGPSDLTFLESAKFADAVPSCRAGALLTTTRFAGSAPKGVAVLTAKEPYKAFVAVMRSFYPEALKPMPAYGETGVAAGATVHPTAKLAAGVTVEPGAVIGAHAEIGANTVIGANAVIGKHVRIGSDGTIGPNCTINHTMIGDRVLIHPGCSIGQDGYGYVSGAKGHDKIPQVGMVEIHDDVEIGAGTCIDRGGIRNTVIGNGTKIDNLVHMAHNVMIGRNCLITGQAGLAGSVTIEDNVILAGSVGVAPHAVIRKGAILAARSGVFGEVPAGETWGGYPARPRMRWLREQAALGRLISPKGKDNDGK